MTKAQSLAGEWLANLAKIVLVWFIAIMSLEGARFDQLITQKALVALALSIATWLLLCVQSWQRTGSIEPVPAAHVEAISGELLSVESHLAEDIATGIVEGFQRANEATAALQQWHQGEAGPSDGTAPDENGQDQPYVPTPLPPDVPAPPVPVAV